MCHGQMPIFIPFKRVSSGNERYTKYLSLFFERVGSWNETVSKIKFKKHINKL